VLLQTYLGIVRNIILEIKVIPAESNQKLKTNKKTRRKCFGPPEEKYAILVSSLKYFDF